MRFAVSLLSVLGVASIIGTVLQQNKPYNDYIIKFGQFWFELFNMLGLYDVYHAVWFLVILLFLVISTSLCIYRNTPHMLNEWRTFKEQATEKSLQHFSHQASFDVAQPLDNTQAKLAQYLTGQGFKYKTKTQANGDVMMAAKAGTHQRFGYIFTHAAIVIICFGGLLDGNLPLKIQQMLGNKKVEMNNLPASQIPEESRLGVNNLSFRANMSLPEGEQSPYSFVRVKDGYMMQELPFTVALKSFRIKHYATGQPKSFESDIQIIDPELPAPIEKTIRVNHPVIHKGIAIYQSDFSDGGSTLHFNVWDFSTPDTQPVKLDGIVKTRTVLPPSDGTIGVEFDEFRKFNVMNLTMDVNGEKKNVGPNTTYKLRDSAGQAKEYVTYMQPLQIDGRDFFVSGMRETVQDAFRYFRIPADENGEIDRFIQFRSVLLNPEMYPVIANSIAQSIEDDKAKADFADSVVKLLDMFARGGYTEVAKQIETSVPEKEREKAATAYLKLLNTCALLAYEVSVQETEKAGEAMTEADVMFVQDSLNAINDSFFFGTPYFFQLADYKHRQASGLMLAKSPGQKWVYLGSALLVLGVFAMFYIRERRIWLLIKPNQSVKMGMASNRKNLDFDQEFARIRTQLSQVLS